MLRGCNTWGKKIIVSYFYGKVNIRVVFSGKNKQKKNSAVSNSQRAYAP